MPRKKQRLFHQNFDNQDKKGTKNWVFDVGLLATIGIVALIIAFSFFNGGSNKDKKNLSNTADMISKNVTDARDNMNSTNSNEQTEPTMPVSDESNDAQGAFDSSLDPTKRITVSNLNLDTSGHGSITYNGVDYHIKLAGIEMIPQSSRFYLENQDNIQKSLSYVLNTYKDTIQVQRPKQEPQNDETEVYLYLNNQMFQQLWLAKGLAYIPQSAGASIYSAALYSAQGVAQSKHTNIWQIKDIIVTQNNKNLYSSQNEKNFYDNGGATKFQEIKHESISTKIRKIFS